MADIRELLEEETRKIIHRVDEWGRVLWYELTKPPPAVPSRILQVSETGATTMTTTPPTQPVQLAQGQTDTIALAIATADGTVIPGVVLDPGATVTVSDGDALTAALSADQTSVLVTPSPAGGSAVSVQVNGTVNAVAMTPDPTTYDVAPAVVAPVPAEIVQTPGAPS